MNSLTPLLRQHGLPPLSALRMDYRKQGHQVSDKTFNALLNVVYNAVFQKIMVFRQNMVFSINAMETAQYQIWKMILDSSPDDTVRALRFLKVFQLLTAMTIWRPSPAMFDSAAKLARVKVEFLQGTGKPCMARYARGTVEIACS